MSSQQWIRDFTVTDDDIEYLTSLLFEREIPLGLDEMARALVERRIEQEAAAQRERFKDVTPYNPAKAYQVGQRVVFPMFDYQVAQVVGVRPGENPDYESFSVIQVQFEDNGDETREFAAELSVPHKLSEWGDDALMPTIDGSPDDILRQHRQEILPALRERLRTDSDLVSVAGKWFSRGLMLDVNEGYLNLAEAVLDMHGGGPLPTEQILNEIGGLGTSRVELQIFSLNDALNRDPRFDEVGPINTVLWYLRRFEPQEVLNTPPSLKYTPIEYDPTLLSSEQEALEAEIDDEWSLETDEEDEDVDVNAVTLTLTYPHWRAGTLPLNSKMRRIFPTARRTQRIAVTLIDGQDGEEYSGWVVRPDRYVFGLKDFFEKHKLPTGAYIDIRRSDERGKIIVDYRAHRPRTEWVRVVTPNAGQLTFEDQRRSIGAEYDDLMILWLDDLAGADAVSQSAQSQKRSLSAMLRALTADLNRLSPQGTVHAKTLYSAVNVLRRCPPGPIFAALNTDPEFEYVGNHYWRLSGS